LLTGLEQATDCDGYSRVSTCRGARLRGRWSDGDVHWRPYCTAFGSASCGLAQLLAALLTLAGLLRLATRLSVLAAGLPGPATRRAGLSRLAVSLASAALLAATMECVAITGKEGSRGVKLLGVLLAGKPRHTERPWAAYYSPAPIGSRPQRLGPACRDTPSRRTRPPSRETPSGPTPPT
jgi:hypothetical protein